MVGLSDQELKHYVFQTCESYMSVDALRAVCSAFEAARRDAGGSSPHPACAAGTAGEVEEPASVNVAAARTHTSSPDKEELATLWILWVQPCPWPSKLPR